MLLEGFGRKCIIKLLSSLNNIVGIVCLVVFVVSLVVFGDPVDKETSI